MPTDQFSISTITDKLPPTMQPIVHDRWAHCGSPVVTLISANFPPVHLVCTDHDTDLLRAGLTYLITHADNKFTLYYLGQPVATSTNLTALLDNPTITTITTIKPDQLLSRAAGSAVLLRTVVHHAFDHALEDADAIAQYLICTQLTMPRRSLLRQAAATNIDHLRALQIRRSQPAAVIVADLNQLIERTDKTAVRRFLYEQTGGHDVSAAVYELFMSHYNPQCRTNHGIYHTPSPIVEAVIGLVTDLLTDLPDQQVIFIDPAVGTGPFLTTASRYHPTAVCMGYDIMAAACLLAADQLSSTDTYISNADALTIDQPLTTSRLPIIIGNPPYRGKSSNPSYRTTSITTSDRYIRSWTITETGRAQPVHGQAGTPRMLKQPTFIGSLLKDYFICDHQWITERNLKWLHDDYVKFIRWAQWQVDSRGMGITAFITNHGYLDNPTFRGMRWQLLRSFSDIYIINLQGNINSRTDDENLFTIKQGTAMAFLLKRQHTSQLAKVHYVQLQGSKQDKLTWLGSATMDTVPWTTHTPASPYYNFIPAVSMTRHHTQWTAANAIPTYSAAIVTARDHFAVGWSKKDLHDKLTLFAALPPETARNQFSLGSDVRDWKTDLAQRDLLLTGLDPDRIIPVLYRPFDIRCIYYTGKSRGIICMPRRRITDLLKTGNNICLITVRRTPPATDRPYILVANLPVISGAIRSDNYSIDTVFPLYVTDNHGRLTPNISPAFITALESTTGLSYDLQTTADTFSPPDVFAYIYACIYATDYAHSYGPIIDFPPLPLPTGREQFHSLVLLGHQLLKLHLPPLPDRSQPPDITIPHGYPRYENQTIWINPDHSVTGVSQQSWDFRIGSYQPLKKWIKDRRSRGVSFPDLAYYRSIVDAVTATIDVIAAIDDIYSQST